MNWAAYTLLFLYIMNVLITPLLYGNEKGKWGAGDCIAALIFLTLALFAFEVIHA